LLSALGGQDEQARAVARQLLPREGIGVVPRLLPLLASDKAGVREAAFNVLADLANEASAPGRAEDRKIMSGHLMTLLASNQPADLKIRGLRLIPIACPPDGDVSPVAALLADPELRERSREALEEIGTAPSRTALRDFLGKANPDFACALLNSLSRLHDEKSLDTIVAMLNNGPANVRVAAARALAWTGDPNYLKPVQKLADTAEPGLRAEPTDALLRLLDAMARRPAHRQAALAGYLTLLSSAQGQVKDGALAGLGRLGDSSAAPAILSAIEKSEPPTLSVGIAALAALTGADVTRALIDAYPGLPARTQAALLPILGSRRDPLVLTILKQSVHAPGGQHRLVALEALAETGLSEAMSFLAAEENQGDNSYRAQVKAIRTRAIERENARLRERISRGVGSDAGLLGELGIIGRWWVVGPFDLGENDQGWETSYIGEPNVSVVARYMAGKVRRQWKPVASHDSQGKIDLRATIADRDHCIGYAYAEIELDKATDAVLLLGVDDGEKVWVNGVKAFELFTRRGLQVDQDRVPVQLKAGTNTILLKIFQDTLGWEFCARIATDDGRQPVRFVQKAE
jgi:HEAT repeat protein